MKRLVFLFLCACPGQLAEPNRFTTASLAFTCDPSVDVPRDILKPRCATSGCHTAASLAGDLDLESDGLALRMYGTEATFCPKHQLLDTANPFGGYFFDKVTQAEPACGTRMPQTGAQLTPTEIECLHLYIANELERAAAEQQ